MTEEERQILLAENTALRAQLAAAPCLIAQLQARVAALEQLKTPPPVRQTRPTRPHRPAPA